MPAPIAFPQGTSERCVDHSGKFLLRQLIVRGRLQYTAVAGVRLDIQSRTTRTSRPCPLPPEGQCNGVKLLEVVVAEEGGASSEPPFHRPPGGSGQCREVQVVLLRMSTLSRGDRCTYYKRPRSTSWRIRPRGGLQAHK